MTAQSGAAPVGIFELGAEAARAEIHLGAQERLAVAVAQLAAARPCAGSRRCASGSIAVTTTSGSGFCAVSSGEFTALSAASSRETPIENPVAGTGSERKRPTSPS